MYKKIDDLTRILCNVILCKDKSGHESLEIFYQFVICCREVSKTTEIYNLSTRPKLGNTK